MTLRRHLHQAYGIRRSELPPLLRSLWARSDLKKLNPFKKPSINGRFTGLEVLGLLAKFVSFIPGIIAIEIADDE